MSGIDGTYRGHLVIKYGSLGFFAIIYYGHMKLLYKHFPSFKKLHETNFLYRVVMDVISTYTFSYILVGGTDQIHIIQLVAKISTLIVGLLSKDILVNFLRNPNPKPEFEMIFNEKDELKGIRFLATKFAKSMTMIITCLTIMAVDYPKISPRKLCKTEDQGFSFMDSGVALVMIFSGMTNPLVVKQDCKNSIPPFMKGL